MLKLLLLEAIAPAAAAVASKKSSGREFEVSSSENADASRNTKKKAGPSAETPLVGELQLL